MREFENRRKIKKIMSSFWVLLPLAVLLAFLTRGTWNIYIKDRESVADLRSSQDRLISLERRKENISNAIDKLKTDAGIESEIRDRFQMAKEGEQEVIIMENSADKATSTSAKLGFLQKIWNFFTIR